jgi:hypothetical protein
MRCEAVGVGYLFGKPLTQYPAPAGNCFLEGRLLLTPCAACPAALVLCSAELVPAFLKLLRDSESEVRSTAAGKVAAFSRMLTPQQVVTQVIPCVKELANDTGQFVRASLAQVGGGLPRQEAGVAAAQQWRPAAN